MKKQWDFRKHLMVAGWMRVVMVVLLAVVVAMVGSPAVANDKNNDRDRNNDQGACVQTSQAALKACWNSASDDYWIAVGTCDNISNSKEKQACLSKAQSSQKDALQTCRDQFDARQEVCQELGGGPYDPNIKPSNFSA